MNLCSECGHPLAWPAEIEVSKCFKCQDKPEDKSDAVHRER